MSVAISDVKDLENIIKDPNINNTNGLSHNNGNDPYKHFVSTTLLPFVTYDQFCSGHHLHCCQPHFLLLTEPSAFVSVLAFPSNPP